MGIYRGPGGTGDAVNDAASEAIITVQAKDAALAAQAAAEAAQAAAELAETNAETAETNAETAETNAETAATNAASSASAASTSASNAATSATNAANSATAAQTAETNAETAETNAAASASAASTSASNAATSATNASNSASAASTSATNASNSASAAATSATNAANSATAAQTAQTAAELAETNAETAEANAETAEANAAASASAAATSATNASNSASAAATSATNASNSASAAATSATNASNSASAAATSASNAATSESNAASSASAAAASYDSFDDRYLGAKSSAPTLDNDGNTLLVGALYYDTVSSSMKVWSGSAWLDAYASLSGALIASNNLSDLTNTSTARDNLGVEIGVDVQAYDADTAKYDDVTANFTGTLQNGGSNVVVDSDIGVTVQAYDADTAKLDVAQSWSAAQSFNAGVTLGDASGDALTINSSAVSIPNGLNFDSNTLVIDATNNRVGVGTASPNSKLAVGGNPPTAGAIAGVASAGGYSLSLSDNVNNSLYITHPAGNAATIATDSGGALAFATNGTSEKLRIDTSGNVGIGTSSPNTKLEVVGAVRATNSGSSGYFYRGYRSGTTSAWYVYDSGTEVQMTVEQVNPLLFGTSNTERMRITSGGNVGIGTNDPASFRLSVAGRTYVKDSGTNTPLVIETTASGSNYIQMTSTTGSAYIGNIGDAVGLYTGGGATERMRIDSSGNVGIGTSSPNARFNVSTATAKATASTINSGIFSSSDAPGSSDLLLAIRQGGSATQSARWTGIQSYENGYGVQNLVLQDLGGNVGIGTTAPTTQLEIKSAAFTDSEITLDNTSSNTTSRVLFKAAGTEYGRVTGDSTQVLLQSGNIPIAFRTNGSERMRIASTGAIGLSGANYGTSGQVLTSQGSGAAPSWQTAASGQGGRGQVFTSSGTFTIPTGVTALKIIVVGAGGGGNGGWGYLQDPDIGGGGGGGGGTAISYLTGLTSGGTLTVTIGAGGAAKASYGGSGAGNSGGSSTVASGTQSITTITGGGGAGALQTSSPRPGRGGAGGTATNGTINISGGAGGDGSAWSNSVSIGGCGGASLLSGNVAPPNTSGSGDTGLNYGGGGAGGSTADTNTGGGAGANGIVIFEW